MYPLRVVVVLLSMLLPCLGLISGIYGLHRDFKHWRWYIFTMALFVWSVGYGYVPDIPEGYADIMGYWSYVDRIKDYDLIDVWDVGYSGRAEVFAVFSWIIGRLGDKHLMPAITSFTIYYIGLYITCRVAEDFEIDMKHFWWYIVFLMFTLNLSNIVNNTRNVFAISLFGLGLFRDMYEGKRNLVTLILYTVPLFIHNSTYVLVLVRIIIPFAKRWLLPFIVGVFFSQTILVYALDNFDFYSDKNSFLMSIGDVVSKADGYFGSSVLSDASASYLFRMGYEGIALIFCIVAFCMLRKKNQKYLSRMAKWESIQNMVIFCCCLGLIALACYPMRAHNYWRFVAGLVVFGSSIFLPCLQYYEESMRRMMLSSYFFMVLCSGLWMRTFLNTINFVNLIYGQILSSPILVTLKLLWN